VIIDKKYNVYLILKSGGSVFLGTNPVIILSISEVF
jgi:hypothetical protein